MAMDSLLVMMKVSDEVHILTDCDQQSEVGDRGVGRRSEVPLWLMIMLAGRDA